MLIGAWLMIMKIALMASLLAAAAAVITAMLTHRD